MSNPSGSGEVVQLVLSWAVTTLVTFVIVILDERRMDDDRLERAWPPSSRDAAIVAFGVLALPVHFVKTRGHLRSVRGLLGLLLGLVLGIVAILVVALVSEIVLQGVSVVVGLPVQ
jgi:hypothetical protein